MENHFERDVIAYEPLPEPQLSARFGDAMNLAVALHRKHSRKGTAVPYASHLLAVASLVLEHGGSEDEAIAALLHDAIEDQSGDDPEPLKREIEGRFGPAVLETVMGCSDASTSTNKGSWESRKRAYIDHLADTTDSTRLVSLADKVHNARAILADYRRLGEALWKRFNGGRAGTLWYYRALVTAFSREGQHGLVDELDRTVSEVERLAGRSA